MGLLAPLGETTHVQPAVHPFAHLLLFSPSQSSWSGCQVPSPQRVQSSRHALLPLSSPLSHVSPCKTPNLWAHRRILHGSSVLPHQSISAHGPQAVRRASPALAENER